MEVELFHKLSDVCGNITIYDSQLNGWSYATKGTGSINEETGTITLIYSVDGFFTQRTITLVK